MIYYEYEITHTGRFHKKTRCFPHLKPLGIFPSYTACNLPAKAYICT